MPEKNIDSNGTNNQKNDYLKKNLSYLEIS